MNTALASMCDELEKIAISQHRLRLNKVRNGRRPLSVTNWLKKEKDGSLYKDFKLAGVLDSAYGPPASPGPPEARVGKAATAKSKAGDSPSLDEPGPAKTDQSQNFVSTTAAYRGF